MGLDTKKCLQWIGVLVDAYGRQRAGGLGIVGEQRNDGGLRKVGWLGVIFGQGAVSRVGKLGIGVD